MRLGRDPGCDVVIPEATVSRRHAEVRWDGRELVVEDLGSSGGTFLNEARVQHAVVQPGDILRLGPRTEYQVSPDVASTPLEIAAEKTGGEEGVKHLQMLLDVASALNAATVLEEVVQIVLQSAIRLVRADRGCVMLIEADGSRRTVACHPADLGKTAWAEHSSLFERAIKERHVVSAGLELSPSTTMVARGAAMAVASPLVVTRRPMGRGEDASFVASVEVLGGILVERERAGQPFGRDDLAVLESVTAEAAIAIDSARLYREAREKAKIDYEMSLARTIQMALLRKPPETPFAQVFAFSQAARSVGGDLYNGMLRDDGSLAVALGDVSGKGVGAALIMAMAQGLLGLLNELGHPIEQMLPALNRNLLQHNPGNRFLTLALGILQANGVLSLGNAGHCPLVLLRENGTVELVASHGPILGLLPAANWGVATVQLAKGDSVVLYSDGISESFSPRGEEFGVEGVQRTLAALGGKEAEVVGRGLLEAAAAHRAGREAEDDVTLLVLRFRG
jgi:sigma-B regulation protein RsbU (phosphoserine phosphatase)